MSRFIFSLLTIILGVLLTIHNTPVYAITDPLVVSNNRFGIHITDDTDIKGAAQLVNTQGGDWGYVTLVIRQDERDTTRWQNTFDTLRRHHLIPIIRLATTFHNDAWDKPQLSQVNDWINFFNSLNWVVQNRYLIIFNEPNHAPEWGGQVNPNEYADILTGYYQAFKTASPDYYILPAALDAAAPNSSQTLSFIQFYRQMHDYQPAILDYMDGWNSHSYPNPGFTASPYKLGLTGIRGYQTELSLLKPLGLKSPLPVFITETGWSQAFTPRSTSGLNPVTIDRYYRIAFSQIWTDPVLVAITPFIMDYPASPFSQFSWQQPNSDSYYPWYESVKSLPKTTGNPAQLHRGFTAGLYLPQQLIIDRSYQTHLQLANTGQSIWEPGSIQVTLQTPSPHLTIPSSTNTQMVEPRQAIHIPLLVSTGTTPAFTTFSLEAKLNGQTIDPPQTYSVSLVNPNVVTQFKIWLYQNLHSDQFTFL